MGTKSDSGGRLTKRFVQRVTARAAFTMVLAGCVFLTLTAGAFASTKTDYDHSVNFERYQTFAWKNDRIAANGLANNSIVASRIRNAVDEQLRKKGMREDGRHPDVYVVAHV